MVEIYKQQLEEQTTIEAPEEIGPENVIYWSESAQELKGIKEGNAIKTKALRFLKHNLVEYRPYTQDWIIKPIKGYNNTVHRVCCSGGNFSCSCQFYQTVSYQWEKPLCSHIQAVKFWLEIARWNNKKEV